LNQAADHTASQGGFFNRASGAVTHAVADTFSNAANVFDPDQNANARLTGLGLLVLDASGGTEGKGAKKAITELGQSTVTRAVKELDVAARAVQSVEDIAGYTKHGINQIINNSVSPDLIKNTITNTIAVQKRVDEAGRISFRYIGDKAEVAFNDARKVITAIRTTSK